MKKLISLGIIAEYNPLHNGHVYHINETKKLTNPDCVIVIMSGNFVQRGAPALINKYERTKMALMAGADLVIELPVQYATSSAQLFARGSILLLNALKADHLCFGTEVGSLDSLSTIANILTSNNPLYETALKNYASTGMLYPLAREKALTDVLGVKKDNNKENILSQSNNILGIEYLCELKKTNSSIKPHTIARMNNQYNDLTLTGNLSSATAIREHLFKEASIPYNTLPEESANILKEYSENMAFINIDDFSDILRYKLIQDSYLGMMPTDIADMSEPLLNKLMSKKDSFTTISKLIEAVKSKDITYTRISRAIIHYLLNITVDDYKKAAKGNVEYIRVLGLNDSGAKYLSTIKKECPLPIITKPADYKDLLSKDIFASDVYNLALSSQIKRPVKNDYTHPIIKL